mmetsp:Transcript_10123/g.21914  ORF Transcript_10123/g.21914 Transcript_10123/m.21914 type:complete len:213 (+) Transcript_10123:427-1065(+)
MHPKAQFGIVHVDISARAGRPIVQSMRIAHERAVVARGIHDRFARLQLMQGRTMSIPYRVKVGDVEPRRHAFVIRFLCRNEEEPRQDDARFIRALEPWIVPPGDMLGNGVGSIQPRAEMGSVTHGFFVRCDAGLIITAISRFALPFVVKVKINVLISIHHGRPRTSLILELTQARRVEGTLPQSMLFVQRFFIIHPLLHPRIPLIQFFIPRI